MSAATTQRLWDSLAALTPTLVPHIRLQHRHIRGSSWCILHNAISGDQLRVDESIAALLNRLDGGTKLKCIVAEAQSDADADSDTRLWQDDVADAVLLLAQHGMLRLGTSGDATRLLQRQDQLARQSFRQRWLNPLAIRIPLLNPDQRIAALSRYTDHLFNRSVLIAVMAIMLIALLTGLGEQQRIGDDLARMIDSPRHWWLFALVYPALKCLHELAHAIAIKRWGGAVHEMGITILILMPVPYVDASDSWMFNKRYQRIVVSAAGMLAEGLVAAIAVLIYSVVEPGVVRDMAFATALTGSVSTLLFNANPLLKFDGYQILQDVIDIPNLARRASAYLNYLMRRYLLGVTTARSPVSAARERRWLLSYATLAIAYRWVITVSIVLFLVSVFPFIGAALALFAIWQLACRPLLSAQRWLRTAPEIEGRRKPVLMRGAATAFTVLLALVLLPLPSSTRATGVLWVADQAEVFAAASGTLKELLVEPGEVVQRGDLLMEFESPELVTELALLQAQHRTLATMRLGDMQSNPGEARRTGVAMADLDRRIQRLQEQQAALLIHASGPGRFALADRQLVPGARVKQGQLLGFVVPDGERWVRAVIGQRQFERVEQGVDRVRVRLAQHLGEALPATLVQQLPAGDRHLPSPALAYDGLSGIAVATEGNDKLTTREPVFHLELRVDTPLQTVGIGGRAYVTLRHHAESLGRRWWRATRQLLLDELSV